MRETFRVRAFERVDPGFLTTVEIFRRKVAWNVEDFFWIDDPKYTLALADEFGFVGKKQLVQTKNILVAPGSKTMNEGLHDGADVLDERETKQRRSLIGTTVNDGLDRPETQYTTEESARFMSDPTRAVKYMLKRLRKHHSEAPVLSWSFAYQEMRCEVSVEKGAYWEGGLEGLSTTGAWICFGGYLLETYSSTQQIVALSSTESEYISTRDVAHALEIRSDLAECDMTLRMKGKMDVTAGRAMAARRGVGRVHHLDARFSWLQRLWAEGVVHWCLRSSRPEEHNKADLESKKIDSTLLLKGTPLRPPMSSSSWSLRMVASSFSEVEAARDSRVSIWNARNVCETNGWYWICVEMVIAILTVLSGVPSGISMSDDCSQQKETDENAAWRRQMKRARTPCRISKIRTTSWNPSGSGVICRSVKPADAGGTGVACGRKSCMCCW